MTTTDSLVTTVPLGSAVVIVRGKHSNEPGVVVAVYARTLDVLLGRTGERVTVRVSSVEWYD